MKSIISCTALFGGLWLATTPVMAQQNGITDTRNS